VGPLGKRWVLLLIFLLFSGPVLAGPPEIPEIIKEDGVWYAGSGWRVDLDGLRVGFFKGTPLEMGIQNGLLMMDDPDEMYEKMQEMMPGAGAETRLERLEWFFKNLYARLQFFPAFLRHIPGEYVEEMQGFVLGASRGEDDDYSDILFSNAYQDLEIAACSAFAAWGEATVDGELYVGRNLDHGAMLELAETQYLGIYKPDEGYPFAVHNYPSFVGTMSGMNEPGLTLTSNYSMAKRSEITIDGLPYMLMMRHVLQNAATIEEALEIIKNTPRTIGLTLLLTDARTPEAVVVELTADRVQVREQESYIYAANRFLHPEMIEFQSTGWLASALREERFEELIRDKYWGQIDHIVSADIMRDRMPPGEQPPHSMGSGINNEVNLAAMVMVPARGEFWLSVVDESPIPFAADNHFVGVGVGEIWATGEPPRQSLGTLPATPREGYEKYWFKARRAVLLVGQGELEQAQELLQEVLAVYPEAEQALLLKGRLLVRQGQLEQGREYLERYVQLEVHSDPFYLLEGKFWLAVVYDQLDQRELAVEYYTRALQVEVEDLPEAEAGYRYFAGRGQEQPLGLTPEGRVIVP